MDERIEAFIKMLGNRPEKNIAVVSHSGTQSHALRMSLVPSASSCFVCFRQRLVHTDSDAWKVAGFMARLFEHHIGWREENGSFQLKNGEIRSMCIEFADANHYHKTDWADFAQ